MRGRAPLRATSSPLPPSTSAARQPAALLPFRACLAPISHISCVALRPPAVLVCCTVPSPPAPPLFVVQSFGAADARTRARRAHAQPSCTARARAVAAARTPPCPSRPRARPCPASLAPPGCALFLRSRRARRRRGLGTALPRPPWLSRRSHCQPRRPWPRAPVVLPSARVILSHPLPLVSFSPPCSRCAARVRSLARSFARSRVRTTRSRVSFARARDRECARARVHVRLALVAPLRRSSAVCARVHCAFSAAVTASVNQCERSGVSLSRSSAIGGVRRNPLESPSRAARAAAARCARRGAGSRARRGRAPCR